MKKILCTTLLLAAVAFAQENYSQWAAYKTISVNTTNDTTHGAANVQGTVTNFPTLVRLTSANSDVFTQGSAAAADIRFTDSLGTTRYKHQTERWDAVNQVAEFWVLIPSIPGQAITKFRMYWGKSGVSDSSSGKSVFDTGNGFRGVWHMNGNGNELDATVNGDTMVAFTGGVPTAVASGAIGPARGFDGATTFLIGSSPTTATGPLNITSTSPNTVSAWVNASVLSTSTSSGNSIINKGDKQYNLQMYDLKWQLATYSSTYEQVISPANAVAGGWYYVTGVWPGGTTGNVNARLYLNGLPVKTSALSSSNSNPTTASNVYIGVNPSSGSVGPAPGDPNTAPSSSDPRYWNGLLDEINVAATVRDSNWIKLSYQTQQPAATALSLGASIATSDTVKILVNPVNQFAGLGGSASFIVVPSGQGPLTTKWVHIHGASTDTISGATSDTLRLTALPQADTGSYKAIVSNSFGTAVSTAASLVFVVAPVITVQPLAQTASVGTSVNLFVGATSIAPLSYQWIRIQGGTADTLPGATNDTLKLASVAATDSGTYKVIVKNVAGATLSNAAILTVPVSIWSAHNNSTFLIQTTGSSLTFHIPSGASGIRVTIADIGGRTVWRQTLRSENSSDFTWSGKSSGVPAGIYLVRASTLDAKGNILNSLQGKFTYSP